MSPSAPVSSVRQIRGAKWMALITQGVVIADVRIGKKLVNYEFRVANHIPWVDLLSQHYGGVVDLRAAVVTLLDSMLPLTFMNDDCHSKELCTVHV